MHITIGKSEFVSSKTVVYVSNSEYSIMNEFNIFLEVNVLWLERKNQLRTLWNDKFVDIVIYFSDNAMLTRVELITSWTFSLS